MKTIYRKNKTGFSLVEVLLATIIMSMLMVTTFAFVQYGGDIWQKGHTKISAENYKRMAFELIKADMMRVYSIHQPLASSTSVITDTAIGYRFMDGGTKDCVISIATPAERILYRRCTNDPNFNMRIARNVASFTASRISTWTIQIRLQIQSDTPDEDGSFPLLSDDTVTFMAPGAG